MATTCAASIAVAASSLKRDDARTQRATRFALSSRAPAPARLSSSTTPVARIQKGRLQVMARQPDPCLIPRVPMFEGDVDVMGYLKTNRIIFVGAPITDKLCVQIVADLLAMEAAAPGEEIKIYLNSPESIPYHIVAIIDVIKQLKCPVSTVGFGMVGGVSALLLAAGTKGRRFAMPNSRILIHQPMGGAQGSAVEVGIQAKELSRTMRVVCKLYNEYTGQDEDFLREEIDRDNFMSPAQAVEFGLIDAVI
mmetsp:Transcript_30173/g.65918  ORF Transcript_30173/g.65918 Transcript_30173/m.65918 type:complete len:251 (-) Transcript_30173:121-873(-)|eukprot:CAMPEP_0118933110 /NCGR_PEP_ID=MMETSP1169-20130426/11320_1 /TAXON_ID=36882 /ORGANISM="Pyramimonas obovata, Strain CCMP722" /LENGTH=250 /DNA_ID=CAMNT_0006875837 /DNA_START=57 /DNA_END=809 /DNA_ORIENTATION=-